MIEAIYSHGGRLETNHNTDSGFDLFFKGWMRPRDNITYWCDEVPMCTSIYIEPFETILIKTGVQIQLPSPKETMVYINGKWNRSSKIIEGKIRGRSGVSLKTPLVVKEGTIDNGFSGDLGIVVMNCSDKPYNLMNGTKLAQIVFEEIYKPYAIVLVESFEEETDRALKSFGSSGS